MRLFISYSFSFMTLFIGAVSLFGLATPTYAQSTIQTQWSNISNNTAVHGGVSVAGGTDTDKGDGVIQVVKNFINYVLGFLGLVALIFLLWGGFQIVTAGDDGDAYQKGLGTLKNAAIGIAFIGIAWFLVTFIFYVFNLIAS
ncbi:MAG: pilin [Candidatus Absconditabacterales bacterium]|nr:pilin [Candidatus Absconditabacterales bacterium]